jgi:hypothetical protein
MIANIPGSCLTEQGGQEAVPPVKAATSTEHKKTEDMPRGLAEDRAGVVVEFNKSKSVYAEQRLRYECLRTRNTNTVTLFLNKKGESHEGRFCSSGK